jgi:hypothetical protein
MKESLYDQLAQTIHCLAFIAATEPAGRGFCERPPGHPGDHLPAAPTRCLVRSPRAWYCTRWKDHVGDHVARVAIALDRHDVHALDVWS